LPSFRIEVGWFPWTDSTSAWSIQRFAWQPKDDRGTSHPSFKLFII
jgi:hypothetical protein